MIKYLMFILYITSNFIMAFFWTLALDKKAEKVSNVTYSFWLFLLMLIPSGPKYFTVADTPIWQVIDFLTVIFIFSLIFWGFKNPFWQKLLYAISWYGIVAGAEIITGVVLSQFGIDFDISERDIYGGLGVLLELAILIVCLTIFTLFWEKTISKVSAQHTSVGLLLLISISQSLYWFSICSVTWKEKQQIGNNILIVMMLSFFLFLANLVLITFGIEKSNKLRRIQELNAHMEEERDKYERLIKEVDQLSRIRHEKNNYLVVVEQLAEEGIFEKIESVCEKILIDS